VTPAQFNREALERGELTDEHLVELVRSFQESRGLLPDGKAGPITRMTLDQLVRQPAQLRVVNGWLQGPGVEVIPAHASWFSGPMPRGPLAIMAHYTATNPGTARSLAERRIRRRWPLARNASWHVTIATDGTVYQMVPLNRRARHCARGMVAGLSVNQTTIGIELEGRGKEFPDAQVAAARRVWYSIVHAYGIPQELAMLQHSEFDQGRRQDPGELWMTTHAETVIEHAYVGL